jgi:pilus assembly protein TadC
MTRARRPLLVSLAIGATVAVVVGGWPGLVVGPVVGAGALWWLGRQPPREVADENARVAEELPFVADLLGAALRAGAAPATAARYVADAVGGPSGDRLRRVERLLSLGAPATEAWSYLGDTDAARRIAAAARRSQHSGAAFAGALHRLADDLRADRLIAADAAARRAGTLIVLPLGLCFLPAFVLAGLVPVIVAVLGDVLSS